MAAKVGSRRSSRGFTLVELVITLVLLSALAVFVAPRLSGVSDFQARGFHDETLALLRHAQKSAIAQRRTVCVLFAANSASLRLDADRNAASGTDGCEADLTGPIAVVVGNEGRGMSRLVGEACDFTVSIPMAGRVGSLNAGVAWAVMAFEIVRQRSTSRVQLADGRQPAE